MSSEQIAKLRSQFEDELASNPTLYHPIDIERVRTEDYQVKRYLIDQDGNEAKAFAELIKTLKWKKSFGVHDRTDSDFPKEWWEITGHELVGKDKHGRVICWELARTQRSFTETANLARQFVVHTMERGDRTAGEAGVIFVGDTKGAGISNIDSSLEQFRIDVMQYYPLTLKALYVVDQPWILTAIVKLIMSFMNAKLRALVHFATSDDLTKEIDAEYIPVGMKGKREKRVLPDNLVPLDKMYQKLGLDEKFVNHFYKTCKLERS